MPFGKADNGFREFVQAEYSLCKSYPRKLVFPANASNELIEGSAQFRSSQRLPALTYYDKVTGVSVYRSS